MLGHRSFAFDQTELLLPSGTSTARAGNSIAAADFVGDGFPDVAIGVPDANANLGRVLVYHGTSTGLDLAMPEVLARGGTTVGSFGESLAAMDLEGDMLVDLVVGVPGANEFLMFTSSPIGFTTVPTSRAGPLANTSFGYALTRGDVDGDAIDDLVVGAPFTSDYRGKAYLYTGTGTSFGIAPAQSLDGPDPMGGFGAALGR
jgi:hypothetical protein